jgi:hypothetical protein
VAALTIVSLAFASTVGKKQQKRILFAYQYKESEFKMAT